MKTKKSIYLDVCVLIRLLFAKRRGFDFKKGLEGEMQLKLRFTNTVHVSNFHI